MEHSAVAELRVLSYTLERWSDYIDEYAHKATAEQVSRWKIGIEHDMRNALDNILKQLDVMERVR